VAKRASTSSSELRLASLYQKSVHKLKVIDLFLSVYFFEARLTAHETTITNRERERQGAQVFKGGGREVTVKGDETGLGEPM
jgi:hypothetical protein